MGKPKSPSPAEVLAAVPLSKLATRGSDPIAVCNICGKPSDSLHAWREADEWDRSIAGTDALVFIGNDHAACVKAMEKHPRLYTEVRGDPGHFPALCGPCQNRDGFGCLHPDLKANGGGGLHVDLSAFGLGMIVCGPGGCRTPLPRAVECAGRKEKDRGNSGAGAEPGVSRPAAAPADQPAAPAPAGLTGIGRAGTQRLR